MAKGSFLLVTLLISVAVIGNATSLNDGGEIFAAYPLTGLTIDEVDRTLSGGSRIDRRGGDPLTESVTSNLFDTSITILIPDFTAAAVIALPSPHWDHIESGSADSSRVRRTHWTKHGIRRRENAARAWDDDNAEWAKLMDSPDPPEFVELRERVRVQRAQRIERHEMVTDGNTRPTMAITLDLVREHLQSSSFDVGLIDPKTMKKRSFNTDRVLASLDCTYHGVVRGFGIEETSVAVMMNCLDAPGEFSASIDVQGVGSFSIEPIESVAHFASVSQADADETEHRFNQRTEVYAHALGVVAHRVIFEPHTVDEIERRALGDEMRRQSTAYSPPTSFSPPTSSAYAPPSSAPTSTNSPTHAPTHSPTSTDAPTNAPTSTGAPTSTDSPTPSAPPPTSAPTSTSPPTISPTFMNTTNMTNTTSPTPAPSTDICVVDIQPGLVVTLNTTRGIRAVGRVPMRYMLLAVTSVRAMWTNIRWGPADPSMTMSLCGLFFSHGDYPWVTKPTKVSAEKNLVERFSEWLEGNGEGVEPGDGKNHDGISNCLESMGLIPWGNDWGTKSLGESQNPDKEAWTCDDPGTWWPQARFWARAGTNQFTTKLQAVTVLAANIAHGIGHNIALRHDNRRGCNAGTRRVMTKTPGAFITRFSDVRDCESRITNPGRHSASWMQWWIDNSPNCRSCNNGAFKPSVCGDGKLAFDEECESDTVCCTRSCQIALECADAS